MTDLERLREEAEQEMRRKAPRCERSDRAPSPPPRTRADRRRRRANRRSPRRTLDGADVAAKRRKTASGAPPGAPGEVEIDTSLERYEYAGPSAIISPEGVCGFAATCEFNREKSATKELLERVRPSLPADARLDPVKTPGRGFIFVRLTRAATSLDDATGERAPEKAEAAAAPPSDPSGDDRPASRVLAAAAAAVRSTRENASPACRWLEKLYPVQATCRPDAASLRAAIAAAFAADAGVGDAVRAPGGVRFAVVYANRFKSAAEAGDGAGGASADYRRAAILPLVADAAEKAMREMRRGVEGVPPPGGGAPPGRGGEDGTPAAAAAAEEEEEGGGAGDGGGGGGGGGAGGGHAGEGHAGGGGTGASPPGVSVDLRDPDVVVFAEVLAVPTDAEGGRFARRLALGVVAKSSGVFEVRKGKTAPRSLKRA